MQSNSVLCRSASGLFLLFYAQLLLAQAPDLSLFDGMDMRQIGPSLMSGRVTAVDVTGRYEREIWIGTASGGVWKSQNGGTTWDPVFDEQEVLGIGALKIDPSNPDVIWVGTGEGNPRNSQTSGSGIFRSRDGGKSWTMLGLENTKSIHRICVNPQKGSTVFAGALGSAWGPNRERGVFRTTDNGVSWKNVLFVNDSVGCSDLVMDPVNPDKLFAGMWQYQREPWFFKSGGKGGGLYLTVNGGDTWKRIGEEDGLPSGIWGRVGLAIAPGNNKVVYALIESDTTGLYRSDDGGYKWKLVNNSDVGDRPFYYNEIYVDPTNENHLIYLHSIVSESIDGGKTWSTLLPYSGVHPDHHAFWWSAANPSYMIEGNDGGLNISRDGGRNWDFISNLPLGQFYHINYDMEMPYNVYGGMQDNGSWKGPGYVWHSDGILSSDWQELLFGDGFDVVPSAADSRYVYAMYQGGNVFRVDTQTGEEQYIQPVHPDGTSLRFNWNAAIAQDPHHSVGLYFGSQFLHYSSDNGRNWRLMSPDLTSNDPGKLISQRSGGLTPDVTSAEQHCTILTIAPCPRDQRVVWVGTDDGKVQLTVDGGESWSDLSPAITGLPKGGWIPQIVLSPHKSGRAWVVANNYRRNDWKPYLFFTDDFGKTWKSLIKAGPVRGHCLSIAVDEENENLLFLGTEHGLFISINGGKDWTQWTHDYPSVATQDLKIHPREHDLIIGTFGRAVYVLDDIRPLRRLAADPEFMSKKVLQAAETPEAWQVFYARHNGERFPADNRFTGENRPSGARLGYYYFPTKKAVAGEKEKKIHISILAESGDTLRWFTHKPEKGLNRIQWNFDSEGVRMPTREKIKADADPPGGGMPVSPGRYKVVYRLDSLVDSTFFEVKYDPRQPFNREAWEAQRELDVQWAKQTELAARTFSSIHKARETVKRIRLLTEDLSEAESKALKIATDSIETKIRKLEDRFLLPENATGIMDESQLISTKLSNAQYWIRKGSAMPGRNASEALERVTGEIRRAADDVNRFFEDDWMKWKAEVEKSGIGLFPDFDRL